jgi:curved DNA-binding protein CbpA
MSDLDVEKDYYSILGAETTASQDEIERLYKRLAKRHHPDRGPCAGSYGSKNSRGLGA